MHSRIFQIERIPVSREDWITTECIPEWFVNSIADYVASTSEDDRENNIGWLMGQLTEVCRRDGDKITMNIDLTAFFEPDLGKFKAALTALSTITLAQFATRYETWSLMYDLDNAYNDKYGFYVWMDDGLHTLHEWMRVYAKPLETYYLGGIVDYHS